MVPCMTFQVDIGPVGSHQCDDVYFQPLASTGYVARDAAKSLGDGALLRCRSTVLYLVEVWDVPSSTERTSTGLTLFHILSTFRTASYSRCVSITAFSCLRMPRRRHTHHRIS